MTWNQWVEISRPRFWIYTLGPVLLGIAATGITIPSVAQWYTILALLLFFSLPANLYIYGVNDVYDYETDKLNPKKKGYEKLLNPKDHPILNLVFACILAGAMGYAYIVAPLEVYGSLFLFFILAHYYSSPPIRAKSRPWLDMLFNSLYCMPGLVAFYALGGKNTAPSVLIAAILWCMAMHAYSAIPDIQADKKANISTIATSLGAFSTLALCLILYTASTVLASGLLGWIVYPLWLAYFMMIMLSYRALKSKATIMDVYKWFPWVNTCVGAVLFWYIILV